LYWTRERKAAVAAENMAQLSARQIALAALRLWRKEKRFADSIMSGLLRKAALPPSDRAFALELFYGVLAI